MDERTLTFNALWSFDDIDRKIKFIGKHWRRISDIKIAYYGGTYNLTMVVSEMLKVDEE